MNSKLIAAMAVCGLIFGAGGGARAQDAPASAPAENSAGGVARNARLVPMATALTSLSRASGITIVADRSVMGAQVPMPSTAVTPETLEDAIATLVKSLPSGTVWAKLYLPAPRTGRFDGDAVADYALAQAKLYGNIGGSTPAGTIEVMGQKVGPDRAESVIAALNLKPVYVLVNTARRGDSADAAPANNWNDLSPEQRTQFAQKEAQRLMSMDPQAQKQYFEQQRAVMMQMMQMMTPEQRAQMMQSVGGRPGGGRDGGGRGPGRP